MDARQWNGEPEERHDPDAGGPGLHYICLQCAWRARGGGLAWDHMRANPGHYVVLRDLRLHLEREAT